MNKKQILKHYKENQRLLHLLSHQAAMRCGRPEEDLFGEACAIFMRATTSFDAERGVTFRTYLWRAVHNGLVAFGKKQDLAPDPEHVPEPITTLTPDRRLMLMEWLDGLSHEAREVALIILNGPAEVMGISLQSLHRLSLDQIKRYLRKDLGWKWVTIWKALRELKQQVTHI